MRTFGPRQRLLPKPERRRVLLLRLRGRRLPLAHRRGVGLQPASRSTRTASRSRKATPAPSAVSDASTRRSTSGICPTTRTRSPALRRTCRASALRATSTARPHPLNSDCAASRACASSVVSAIVQSNRQTAVRRRGPVLTLAMRALSQMLRRRPLSTPAASSVPALTRGKRCYGRGVRRTTIAIVLGAATMLTAALSWGCGGMCQDNDMACAPAPLVMSTGPSAAADASSNDAADAAGE